MARATSNVRSEQKEATREQILEAATELLAKHGYAAFRVAAVAQEAGVSLGGQLHHFPTKDSLVIAVLERLSDRVLTLAQRDALADRKGSDPLLLIAESATRFYSAPEFLIYLDIFLSVRRHTLVGDKAVALLLSQRIATERLWLRHLTERGLAEKEALSVIRALWGLCRGLAISSARDKDGANSKTALDLVVRALRQMCFQHRINDETV
ncbi:TetR/AcrR family transcriptional regulator [Bradyrhizobium sp. WSM3983]|uniref:TetR/AcrR family transcriptional regulator n=1 Tax=Bradyrhizobium sp. WSM3983 TaxID=1038867 RepID=UPI0004017D10|nr:TetR/AcrR family transcriptional regulator [Bradyrhizobium sp. WSM3983]